MKHSPEIDRWAEFGLASVIPGLQYAIEIMQQQLDEFRLRLAALQGGKLQGEKKKRVGRPPKSDGRNTWAGMTPEERSAEMRRRQALAREKKEAKPKRVMPPKELAMRRKAAAKARAVLMANIARRKAEEKKARRAPVVKLQETAVA